MIHNKGYPVYLLNKCDINLRPAGPSWAKLGQAGPIITSLGRRQMDRNMKSLKNEFRWLKKYWKEKDTKRKRCKRKRKRKLNPKDFGQKYNTILMYPQWMIKNVNCSISVPFVQTRVWIMLRQNGEFHIILTNTTSHGDTCFTVIGKMSKKMTTFNIIFIRVIVI